MNPPVTYKSYNIYLPPTDPHRTDSTPITFHRYHLLGSTQPQHIIEALPWFDPPSKHPLQQCTSHLKHLWVKLKEDKE